MPDLFPANWKLISLNDAMEAILDYRGKTPRKTESGIPLITAKIVKGGRIRTGTEFIPDEDYDDWMVRGIPEVGDVVLTTEAPLGEVAQIENANVALAQRIITLRGRKGVLNNDFLLYLMQSKYVQHQLESRASGSTVRGIKQSELRKLVLPIPESENEQQTIGAHLKLLDRKIILNYQINQTLEQIAQAIFKSWFVDFDPVKAKQHIRTLDGSDEQTERAALAVIAGAVNLDVITTATNLSTLDTQLTEALNEKLVHQTDAQREQLTTTAIQFPDQFVESEIGLIPEGWAVRALGDLAENHSTTFDFERVDEVVFVNTGDVLEGDFLHKDYSAKEGLPGQAKKAIARDDILVSEIRPKNRRFAYVNFDPEDYVVSTKFMVIRSLGEIVPRYLYLFLRREQTVREFDQIAESRSGTFPQITFDSISYIPQVLPTSDLQLRFVEILESIADMEESLTLSNRTLAKFRDLLLPRLLSGELKINAIPSTTAPS